MAENKVEIAEEKLDNLFPGTPDLKNAEDHPEPVLLSEFEEEVEKDLSKNETDDEKGTQEEEIGDTDMTKMLMKVSVDIMEIYSPPRTTEHAK